MVDLMTTSSLRAGSRRAAAALSSGALALLALAAVAPPAAVAVSPSIDYVCTPQSGGSGTFTLPVVLDTTAPPRLTTGQSTQLVLTAKVTLNDEVAKMVAPTPTHVAATLTPRVTYGAAAADPIVNVPRTAIGDTGDSAAVVLSGSSTTAFPLTAPATPGTIDVVAGTADLTLRADSGGAPNEMTATCAVPNGQPPVVDSISVAAATTTALTLSRTTSGYGQAVTATAKVSTSGSPAGEVSFAVDGIVTRAKVGKDGIASLELPDAAVGPHSVMATFVPADVTAYVGSSSKAQPWTVSTAETRLTIPVTGRTTRTATKVGVKAKGVYRTVPTGTVQIKVKRLGKPGKWVKNRRLDAGGAARMRLGVLAPGRYKVVARYRGDANHVDARKTKTFRVKQR